jgi:all-trans-8'-apo-beta-carotenal 15,15'-oxygenase
MPSDSSLVVDAAPLLERCFQFQETEDSYCVEGIEGSIPSWLRGSYYINGPARFERAGQTYNHWLDGDGMVASLRFMDDGVRFTNRFVRTPKLEAEEAAGKFLYRAFGTAFPGDLLRRKLMLEPPNNVSVYTFGGKLLAFAEQALPFELDPLTLETRGEYDFNGSLSAVSPFAAHAKIDPASGNLLNFGISFSVTQPMLNVYEFAPSGDLLRRRRHALDAQHGMHDFGFTPNYTVFHISPLIMDFQRFWGEGISVMESLKWEPERGARLLIAPRESKTEAAFSVPVNTAFCLHLINCFEKDGSVIVDILEMDRVIFYDYQPVPDLFQTAPPCRPVRYVIDLATQTLKERIAMSYDRCPDFPAVGSEHLSRPYNDFWMLGLGSFGHEGRKFFDQLVRGSWKSAEKSAEIAALYSAPAGEYLGGEPVAIFNPSDDSEAVVIVEHLIPAEGRVEFLLFDGYALESGPIARLPLRRPIHPGFHTSFHFA